MFPSFNARRIWAWDLGIYLALAALAHFSIPLLWQMQWDEWVFLLPALEKDWASLSYQTLGRGLPGEALIYAFLILFKNPVAVSKVLIFINLVFLGAGTAALARSLRVLGPVLC